MRQPIFNYFNYSNYFNYIYYLKSPPPGPAPLPLLHHPVPCPLPLGVPPRLALVVVLNILENKKPANNAEKKHFVSASCRAQHPGKQEASKPCRKKNIMLALVFVLNILLTGHSLPTKYLLPTRYLLTTH